MRLNSLLGSDRTKISKELFFSKEGIENHDIQRRTSESYVQYLFEMLLGRQVSESEKSNWVQSLESQSMNRKEVFEAFIKAEEFRKRYPELAP